MKFWPDDSLRWYENACQMFEYPKRQYGTMISDIVDQEDVVLDLGCGTGAASLFIAPHCRHVIALDQDEAALLHLDRSIAHHHISNITWKHGVWPVNISSEIDIALALHVHKALRSFENLSLLYQTVKKGGFIACPAPSGKDDETFAKLKKELGIPPKYTQCDNGCYTKGILQGLGASVRCQRFYYDFGQPLDCLEEAVSFISWQLGVDASCADMIKKHLELYVTKHNNQYIVPIQRQSCGIVFMK